MLSQVREIHDKTREYAHEEDFYFGKRQIEEKLMEISPYGSLSELRKADPKWLDAATDKVIPFYTT